MGRVWGQWSKQVSRHVFPWYSPRMGVTGGSIVKRHFVLALEVLCWRGKGCWVLSVDKPADKLADQPTDQPSVLL